MSHTKIVDLKVDRWLTETPAAYLFVVNDKRVWLPKSQVEFDEQDSIVSLPESLAIDRELV